MKRPLSKDDERRIACMIAQERVARACQFIALAAGLFGCYWHGLPALLLGGVGYAFFALARPGPDSELDDITGRGR